MSIADAVARARAAWPGRAVEIECDTLDQVAAAKAAGADIVMCDNMAPHQVREAVALLGGAALVEVSGGLGLEGIAEYASAGADFVSIGALTHSAPALDLGLDLDTEEADAEEADTEEADAEEADAEEADAEEADTEEADEADSAG